MRMAGQNVDIMKLKSQLFDIQTNIDMLVNRKNQGIRQLNQLLLQEQEELKKEKEAREKEDKEDKE